MTCSHRGDKDDCCLPVYKCGSPCTPDHCTPTVSMFAAILQENPGLDARTVGDSLHVCEECRHYDGPSRGLGDTVKKVASAVGVTPERLEALGIDDCGCPERQKDWNRKRPYKQEAAE